MSIWYWIQKSITTRVPTVIEAQQLVPKVEDYNPIAVARLLGVRLLAPIAPSEVAANRFTLSGVIASNTGDGVALISVDGAAAKPFQVGAELAPGFVLVAVAPREAMLADSVNAAVRSVLSLSLRVLTQASAFPTSTPNQNIETNAEPNVSSAIAVPDKDSASLVALSPAQPALEQPAVPPRADVRLQPQTSLRRDDVRTP